MPIGIIKFLEGRKGGKKPESRKVTPGATSDNNVRTPSDRIYPGLSPATLVHASMPTLLSVTQADTEEDRQSEPINNLVDNNTTSPQPRPMQTASNQFFMGSHGFTIYGSNFTNIVGTERDRDSDTSEVSVYSRDKLHTWGVVRTRKRWTFNSAVTAKKEGSGESMPVFVQTFEGPEARQLFRNTLEFSRRLVNGHHLNIIGISPSSNSNTKTDAHYIVYERAHSKDTRRLLAAALREGEKETTTVGLRTVQGIASALAHLSKIASDLPLTQIELENFDVFSDELGRTVLCYTPNINGFERPHGSAGHDSEITLCNLLIKKIFTEANHTVWREKLDRYASESATTDIDFVPNNPGNDNEENRNQSQGSAAGVSP
ncbi:hypothetical protein BDP27DRAFT_1428192 [Rhodocollybia butyracea]|uniref:Uncharacterized protein n=1 Tax=Rhodocollybia butyracea TaxID=206335 RepID=A0A9P5PGA5_9AGAR|nr:hypothetical protein BDP27DRAFT_1428192 [Rhodocollybia butyracea]